MSLIYKYEILFVDEQNKGMEVKYTCDGYKEIIVGVPLPTTNQLIEEVVGTYAPLSFWLDSEEKTYLKVCIGDSGYVKTETFNEPSIEDKVRSTRNVYLLNTDWTQLADVNLNETQKLGWAKYRQKLRDLPQEDGWPDKITWPSLPAQNIIPVTTL